jgi:hypothetical protein
MADFFFPFQSGESVWNSKGQTVPAYKFSRYPTKNYPSKGLYGETSHIGRMPPTRYRGRKRRYSGSYGPMKRMKFSGSKRSYGSKQKSGNGITQQYNRSNQYRFKKMPRYKKRGYVKQIRRFDHLLNKSLGSQSVVFNEGTSVTSDSSNQCLSALMMYGARGTNTGATVGNNDINRIFQNIATDASNPELIKLRFETGVLDVTITNVSTGDIPKVEMDVYEVYFYQETNDANFLAQINVAENYTKNINPAGSGLVLGNRGVTPFELPAIGQMAKYKIFKKTKYFLDTNQVMTYQMRDAKNYVVDRLEIANTTNFVQERMTKGILVIGKLVPGNSGDAQVRLTMGCTRAYHYKVNEKASTNDQFNP